MYLRYGIPRALRGLRTNWHANANNVLILAASLAVLGMIVLLYLNVVHFSEVWLSNTSVSLFLRPGLDESQRTALLEQVRQHPLVRDARLVSPAEGLHDLAQKLGADQALLAGAGQEGLPYTIDFDLFVDYRDRVGTVAERFRSLPGVGDVVYTERLLEQVRLFFLMIKIIGGVFIGLILTSFFLIISHATKLSLYARREEIEILNLVGATRAFICSAFIVEGALIALAGGALALGIVWICDQLLVSGLSWNEVTAVIKQQSVFFPLESLGIGLGAAMLLGASSSYLAVSRMLREFQP
jgi:cell division transport system permease protein